MAKEVFITRTNCITPLGFDVDSNIEKIVGGLSGIKLHSNLTKMDASFYAAKIDDDTLNTAFSKIAGINHYTRLEKMMILALQPVIKNSGIQLNARTAFILSTTKGNIAALESEVATIENATLHALAKTIAGFFGFTTEPIVLSNACVSGILAIAVAKRLIQAGMYDHAFIVAGDEVTEFVVSGFNSFQAMSDQPCKPYSKNRNGVTLGEAAAAVLVTGNAKKAKVKIIGDGAVNDANHISGPSRTGEGLFLSVESAIKEANIKAGQIDYISAHGTATPFNDEMEAIAFNRLNLQQVPVNSLKGYYGHTLGASGLLETVIGIASLEKNKLLQCIGYDESGVSESINVIEKTENKPLNYFLKTASGFGGCNTAVIFEKIN